MKNELIAALDVGKTHTRLSLIDPKAGAQVWSAQRVNERVETPIGWQLDIANIERWLIDTLTGRPGKKHLSAVVPIAHGAAAVLIGHDGQILAAPDYEDLRFESVNEAYEAERDPFTASYSPSLPMGLNLGRQLFYLEQREPQVFAQTAHILPYAQFWAWRLSGVLASEVTSLGCHSDLWLPHSRGFSALAQRHGWSTLFPPRRFAGDALACALGPLGESAGLPRDCRIACGIHDSNASYLRYLLGHSDKASATISSGTWTVVMASRARLDRLRAERNMQANVDAFGDPVAAARFMGGREFEIIARTSEAPTLAALRRVIDRGAMALPAFAAGGPFATRQGELLSANQLNEEERAALATLYVALMSDWVLEALAVQGNVIVDGPLAVNPLFAGVLAGLRPGGRIFVDRGESATRAVCYLAGFVQGREATGEQARGIEMEGLEKYRTEWRERLPGTG